MVFRNFRLNIILRIFLLSLSLSLFIIFIYSSYFTATIISVGILIFIQVIMLVQYLEKTNRELIKFLNSIKYDDFSLSYPSAGSGSSFDELNKEFNKVIRKFQELRAEKEANYHYFKTIVQHIGIGIITFQKNGEVQMVNTAAKRLLKVTRLKNIHELESFSKNLVYSFENLKTGGRDLVKIQKGGETVQLAVYAIELVLQGEEFKLISLQNIQSELEEKEMEAWQNLIRVLTHEIMNSVTPISSLAATAGGELLERINGSEGEVTWKKDDLEDIHLAVETIRRRSLGLINFVNDFRNLTRIPQPKIKLLKVSEMFSQIRLLMKAEMEEHKVEFKCVIEPENVTITADPDLIEQVLINLVKNAVQAFHPEHEKRNVVLAATVNNNSRVCIQVIDNGSGIEEEALDKIFIPFFTTKKTGSGIGLSLSRQIMRLHKGNINVKSKLNEGTTFTLTF